MPYTEGLNPVWYMGPDDVMLETAEQKQTKALQSIADSLLIIQQLLSRSTDSEGTLVVGTQPPTYY